MEQEFDLASLMANIVGIIAVLAAIGALYAPLIL
jgi:hypothetical protein